MGWIGHTEHSQLIYPWPFGSSVSYLRAASHFCKVSALFCLSHGQIVEAHEGTEAGEAAAWSRPPLALLVADQSCGPRTTC